MTLARYIETSVQSEESGRCVAATGAAGCRRACMTLQTPSNTARRYPPLTRYVRDPNGLPTSGSGWHKCIEMCKARHIIFDEATSMHLFIL